jgi:hypothetical protein
MRWPPFAAARRLSTFPKPAVNVQDFDIALP